MDITTLYLLPCEKDNPYVLYRNGHGELRNGEVACQEDEMESVEEGN